MKRIATFIFLLGSLQGYAQWSNTADNITTGNLTIGSTVADSYSKFTIKGPNQPTGINNKRDISFEFSSAGQAQIRSYRGTSWDTYLQFLTNDYANTSGIPTPRLHINHDGKIGIGTVTPTVPLEILVPSTSGAEKALKISLSDASPDYLSIENSTGSDGLFGPMLVGHHQTDAIRPSMALLGRVETINDSGTYPIMVFDSRQPNGKANIRPLFQWNSYGTTYMSMSANGNVGIGTTTPASKLQIVGTTTAFTIGEKTTGSTLLDIGLSQQTSGYSFLQCVKTFGSLWGDLIINEKGGNVGIGVNDTKGYKLAIAGNMIAEQVTVKLKGNWPDYVFAPSYNLPSLQETEQHIKEKGHLPGIPSAEEVKNNGVDLGEMNAKLLQKIEELTLHLIEKDKLIQKQEDKFKALEERIKQLENKK